VAGAGDVDGIDLGQARRCELRLQLAPRAVIARGKHYRTARTKFLHRARSIRGLDADHALPLRNKAVDGTFHADVPAEAATIALEVVGKRAGVGDDVVHARVAMRRLRHRTYEHNTVRHQPVEDFVGVLHQYAPQRQIVARGESAGKASEILEMLPGRV